MAQFPIEIGDQAATNEAVNYLLSGPAGLGQNFQGFSAYSERRLRPTLFERQPYSLGLGVSPDASVYLAIPINDIVPVGGATSQFVKFVFTTPRTDIPFQFGDALGVANVVAAGVDPDFYNNIIWTVYSSTVNDVTIVSDISYTWPAYVSGGVVGRNYMDQPLRTDCNARVTVAGPTDQVFVSAQFTGFWEYTSPIVENYEVTLTIQRLKGFPDTTPGSNDYLFTDTTVVSLKTITYTTTGTGPALHNIDTVFTTVLDGPNLDSGLYWYILTIGFNTELTSVEIGTVSMRLRSLTAQVIKQ
jgi:hypothetical protein